MAWFLLVLPLTFLGTLQACSAAQSPPVQAPVAQTAPPSPPAEQPDPPPEAAADAETVDVLLDRLQRSADGLHDLSADVTYHKWDAVLERRETRVGEILYESGTGGKRFAILLNRLIVQTRARNQRKEYVFDGSWLIEIDHDSKMFIKRQIVAPDRQFDPLKLGEGPFPLPIGQPKDEVLARFEVSRIDHADNESLQKRLNGQEFYGLRLVPRDQAPQPDDFTAVELFYDRDSLLLLGVHAVEANGDTKTVILRNVAANQGIDPGKLNVVEPDPRDGWRIDVQPWRE